MAQRPTWYQLLFSFNGTIAQQKQKAATAQCGAAEAEVLQAQTEYSNVSAEVLAAYAQVIAQVASFAAQREQYLAQKQQYDIDIGSARARMDAECSDAKFDLAKQAGFSYSGEDLAVTPSGPGQQRVRRIQGRSFSNAAQIAQAARCTDTQNAFNHATETGKNQKDVTQGLADALQLQIIALGFQFVALPTRLAAAQARVETSFKRRAAAYKERDSQMVAALQGFQAKWGELLQTIVAIDEAFGQAEVATSRVRLEQLLSGYDIRTRFGAASASTSSVASAR